MTLDKELKESLSLSFKYLRTYGEPEIMSVVQGWQGIYGKGNLIDQAIVLENALIKEKSQDDTSVQDQPTTIPVDNDMPENTVVKPHSGGRGIDAKIILSIVVIWGLMIFVTLVKMFS